MAPVTSSSTFDAALAIGNEIVTSSGHIVSLDTILNAGQRSGLQILIGAASISMFSALALLFILAVAASKTFRQPSENRFMRTHVIAYFVSLLFCDVISATGSLMNGTWVSQSAVSLGQICTAQGALKNTGNVGSAMWSMVIAIHTFCLLVLKWRSSDRVLYVTLGLVWAFIALVVFVGPTLIQSMGAKGPYYGVAGYWCWITDSYGLQRFFMEYFWMFLSALTSIVLYTSVFLSLRGNLVVQGWKIGFQGSAQNVNGNASGLAMGKIHASHMIL
ncbi:hypothetical protein M422DRAFT_262199 [Sphaerobolus stellatus SS14]|uniref:Glucose receptor Git3 N-terminal domain-containing protein n=1 Tax=Sphaerobolus stellatus (strain SS14) TaxID=990650 RepID=A0A0C9VDV7_SPHS4|nr:hypothetical protein M422DRAFT_262199 [Sphaerobolus stellatus SS14]